MRSFRSSWNSRSAVGRAGCRRRDHHRHGDRARWRAVPRRLRAGPPCRPEDDGQRAVRQSGPLCRGEPAGRRLPRADPLGRLQGRRQGGREARCRPERLLRFRPAEGADPLDRHFDRSGPGAAAGGARQEDPVRQLHELPRLPVEDGGDRARRGRLARPRQLHAGGDALLARGPPGLQRCAGRGRDLVSHDDVRREFAAAEIAGRPARLQGHADHVSATRRSRSSMWTSRCRARAVSRGRRIPTRTAISGFRNTAPPTRWRGSNPRPARSRNSPRPISARR